MIIRLFSSFVSFSRSNYVLYLCYVFLCFLFLFLYCIVLMMGSAMDPVSKGFHVLSTDALCGFCWCRGVCVLLFNLVIAMARLLLAYVASAPTVCVLLVFRCVSCRASVGAYVVYYYTLGDRTACIFVSLFAFSSFRFGVFVNPICFGVIVA